MEDFGGVQLGADIASMNVNGWNRHEGLTIGHLGSNVKDGTPDLNPPTSFRDSLQIPFVGIYGLQVTAVFSLTGKFPGISSKTWSLTITTDWPVSISMRVV
jgi:hypothetical protein